MSNLRITKITVPCSNCNYPTTVDLPWSMFLQRLFEKAMAVVNDFNAGDLLGGNPQTIRDLQTLGQEVESLRGRPDLIVPYVWTCPSCHATYERPTREADPECPICGHAPIVLTNPQDFAEPASPGERPNA